MKRLYVKHTDLAEIKKQWGINYPKSGLLFIKCTKKGKVNWDKNQIYTLDELLERGKVTRFKTQ